MRISVLFKKGDSSQCKNYRPIAIIPVLSKLYARVLHHRLQSRIDEQLPEEFFGFRPGRGCSDHLHTLRLIAEKAEEWGTTLWAASLDMEKAFDKVEVNAVMKCLADPEVNVEPMYIKAIAALYANLTASVRIDGVDSDRFAVARGVRQGGPLSPLLFVNVMRVAMKSLQRKWTATGFGTEIGTEAGEPRVNYAAFADDLTLLAQSRAVLTEMIHDVKIELAKCGLRLNVEKCVAQCNLFREKVGPSIFVENM